MQLGTKVLIILVTAMFLMAMAGEAIAYTPPIKVSIFPIFGTLNGYVKTTNGDAVSGAMVGVYDSNNTQAGQATTDSHGFYNMSLVGGSYKVSAGSGIGLSDPISVSVTANKVTSMDLTIKSWPNSIWMIPSKDTITADGKDTVKIIIRLMDVYEHTPGNTKWGMVNVKIDDATPITIDPATFTDGATTITYGPLPPTTTMTSGKVRVYTTGLINGQLTNDETFTIVKPAATPTATPPAASPSTAANTPTIEASPTVSPEPVNATVAGPAASNGPGTVQTTGTASGNENTLPYIIGGLLVVVAFMLGVGATYIVLQKKKK